MADVVKEVSTVEAPKEPIEIRTIKIEGKTYDVKSITEKGGHLISNIQKIDEVLAQKQLELGIVNVAKAKMIEDLVKEAVNFQEVLIDPPKEA